MKLENLAAMQEDWMRRHVREAIIVINNHYPEEKLIALFKHNKVVCDNKKTQTRKSLQFDNLIDLYGFILGELMLIKYGNEIINAADYTIFFDKIVTPVDQQFLGGYYTNKLRQVILQLITRIRGETNAK